MKIKFTVYVKNIKNGEFVTSERTRYIPITHPEATKAALITCEELKGPSMYIPGYIQLTVDDTNFFTEEDDTTDLLLMWRYFPFILDNEYLDSKDNEVEITLLDSQTECRITRSSEHFFQLIIERVIYPKGGNAKEDIVKTPLIPQEMFFQAIKEELKNVVEFLQRETALKEDSSYEDILESYNELLKG